MFAFRIFMLHIILMIFLHLAGIITSIISKSYSVCFKWPAYVKLQVIVVTAISIQVCNKT